MSRVYFHSPTLKAAELRGSERAYAGNLISALAVAVIDPGGFDKETQLRAWLPPSHYLQRVAPGLGWARSWATAFSVGIGEPLIVRDGGTVDSWMLGLNTAMVVGNDALRLLARLHAQCEIHGYVEGANRQWLAGIIDDGLVSRLYRRDQGWESVVSMILSNRDEPVVMSYSVCSSFPNPHVANWKDNSDGDGFYELPRAEQWDRALTVLRASGGGLELKPDNFAEVRFGHNFSAFDLFDTPTVAAPPERAPDGQPEEKP